MHNSLENIRWNTVCPWLQLVGSLRLAFRVRVLLLAFTALLLILAAVWLIERLPGDTTNLAHWYFPQTAPDGESLATFSSRAADGLLLPWRTFVAPIAAVLAGTWGFGQSSAVLLLMLWNIVVWSAFGGAICRVAALGLTRGETPDLPHALRFAKRNYGAFFAAPVMTLLGIFLAALPLVILGLLMRIEWLAFIAALFWPVVLLIGLVIAGLAIGLAIGFPLMWAAIAVEETDAFDAISRAYAYLYQRPLRLLWYVLVAALLGWLGGMAIELFLAAARALAETAVIWGLGEAQLIPKEEPSAAQRIIIFWSTGLNVVRTAYYYGYFWCAAVGIYLLLRRDIDSVQLDEVALEDVETYTPSPLVARGATADTQPASS
ncbi:MAG: hypothetical protein WD851_03050 [Pirellulales bacterium]